MEIDNAIIETLAMHFTDNDVHVVDVLGMIVFEIDQSFFIVKKECRGVRIAGQGIETFYSKTKTNSTYGTIKKETYEDIS